MSRQPTNEELKQRIRELEALESERKNDDMMLHRLFELSIDMLCVADITDGCFRVINKAFEKTLGYSKEELLKEPFINFVHPDDRLSTVSAVENLSKGAPAINFDNRYRCKDGSYKWLSWTSMPVPDQGLTYAIARDITDRKRAEEELVKHRDHLKDLVAERTKNLQKVNEELRTKIFEHKQTEKEMRESEEKFRNLFDLSPQVTAVTELKTGKVIDVNKTYCEVTKYTKEEVLGKTATELGFYSDDSRNQFIKELEASGEIQGLEMEFKLKDASTINALMFAKVIRIAGENLIITAFYDLTERKQAEVALQKSEERYRQLANLLPQVVFETDEKGDLTFANRIAFDLFGYTEDDFKKGLHAFEMIIPEERDRAFKKVQSILKGEKSLGSEYSALKKDGSTFPALIYINSIISEGEPVGLRGMIADLSELKRAHKARRESEEKYKELVENANSIILKIDTQGKITLFNEFAQKFFGYSEKEIIGSSVVGTIVPNYDSEGKDLSSMIADFGKHPDLYENNENENILRNGVRVWVAWTNKPILDEKGNVAEILCIGNDITELKLAEEKRKNLEAQLRQAYKMEAIGTLAGGIAHDFNNILAAVFGYTELALDRVEKGSTMENWLHEVLTAGQRAKDLVQQILTFSRQSEQELKPVQINLILKEALKLLRASLPTTVEIRQSIKSDSLVMSDPTQIHQILMNLCTNAGHAMQEKGGVLDVALENVELDSEFVATHQEIEPGPYVQLTVSDTGYGMTQEVMDKIFDPFYTTKEQGEGTGMGLSLVHGIVRSCGGTITVYSEPGKGSAFKAFFPTIERRLDREARVEKPIPKGTERILFVDDELSLVNLGKQNLESLGYEVTTRTSSIEAMGLFKDRPNSFDLVITDMTMPNMPGDELSKNLIAIRPDIPVILCTGFSAGITEEKAKNIGVRGLVSKPILKRDIAETIRKVLDEKG